MGFRDAPPRAAALIESLRGLGYTLPTALADLIDNSIAAGANVVDVDFRWDGEASSIAILDDGRGMSPERLEAAMRLGETNPNDERSADDLGRFGLGLKTVNRRSIGTPYRRAKGTPLLRCWVVDAGRGFRAAGGVGRA